MLKALLSKKQKAQLRYYLIRKFNMQLEQFLVQYDEKDIYGGDLVRAKFNVSIQLDDDLEPDKALWFKNHTTGESNL